MTSRSGAYSENGMAIPSSSGEKPSGKSLQQAEGNESPSRLRAIRLQRQLTQTELARRAGMHRNSIRKLENGTTREITADSASALAAVLKTSVADLGLPVRASVEARSIRFRQLSAEQRQLVDELLSLPQEDYVLIRDALERLRRRRANK